jgi:hypothetical protein
MQTQINNEIHCKVQYGNEFRRFLLKGSYAAMLDQIRVLFGFKNDENLCIKYTDDEGDLVTISSDEELVFAIELFPNSVLRLTISAPVDASKPWKCGRGGPGCGKWARGDSNECDKWEKIRAERAEHWKQKRAQKSAKWEAKRACWETKREKFLNDPEVRKQKLERVEKKLQRLQERRQWIQSKADENAHPCFNHRLNHINNKINRFESFRNMLADPTSPLPVKETPINSTITEADLNAEKEKRGLFLNEITDLKLKIQLKKNEIQALKIQARASEITKEELQERTSQLRKEIDTLRDALQKKATDLHAHDTHIRTIRQDLQALKKAQKQQSH